MTPSEKNARIFIDKTGIGEPSRALLLPNSCSAIWKKGDTFLKIEFFNGRVARITFKNPDTAYNIRHHLDRPLTETILRAIMAVSDKELDFFKEPTLAHPVVYFTDTTTREEGDIVQARIGRQTIEIKKEGHKPLSLSLENLNKIYDRVKLLNAPWGKYVKD